MLIRHVLQYARDYEQAIEWLSQTDIPCDCLLLVCGVNNEQMLVIERTPKKYALRPGVNGRLAVTNDYRIMKAKSEVDETNVIASTSCWRYRRITSLLEREIPMTAEQCFRYLSDEKVIMQITEQQMVFQPATDFLEVRKISI
ncbi:carcinine hydrolase/isopenicillin-N N-acyltransferase family protein [Pleionea sp. CnH1-48]|uniref:carcinine hydrolase/isopenicillin-N N-acyltransferase family protein n=1 Tax=Pleionea sp. CnH1-48 TaxID=2954494 RepID=UPI002097488E|nr:carcinine hydrolase/isopenicillin-N N-acyltransferase family protein [Pleionea sp. CnH1-48]MCO7223129.1 carcinine hydrolase/isopenicillin-N N-acyltransferase family protein [Pleionea sp. CnH1-48]